MKPIPVSILGGYLGSGKTTFLNALLGATDGVRYAVLVNDFGSVNIDAEKIASTGTDTIELTNGCTCCTIGSDLILALKGLLERPDPPDRIVIEASGIADPQAVARLADCHPALSVKGTIVLADAETVRERSRDKYVGGLVRRQLATAGAVVLSKIDLIDEERLADVRTWLEQAVPNATVVESAKGHALAADVLFEAQLSGNLRGDAAGTESHPAFFALTYRSLEPLDRARFLAAVERMLPVAARAKGTVYFADAPGVRCGFQLAGERWTIEPSAVPEGPRESRIVAIALSTRKAELDEAFAGL